jgi:ABC-type branched-subunit amino acid transport system ATPase component
MNETILRVEHLMMHFGGIKALNDVNLDVQRLHYRPDWAKRGGKNNRV